MKVVCALLGALAITICVGCGVTDYYDKYQNALKRIEQLEQELADAKRAISKAQDALTAEQQAVSRLYIEE